MITSEIQGKFINFLRLVVFVVLISNCLPGHSQEVDTDQPNTRVRYEYSNENAPPGVRFEIFISGFAPSQTSDKLKVFAKSRLRSLGFSVDDLPNLTTYFGNLYLEIDEEIGLSFLRMACNFGEASPNGSTLRAAFNAHDDLRLAVNAKYLAITSAELAAMGYDDFVERLNAMSVGFRMINRDNRYAWGDTDDLIRPKFDEICRDLRQRFPAVS